MRLLPLLLLAFVCEARAELTLRAERRFAGFYEHMTLQLSKEKAVATSNSNFLCPNWEERVTLGRAETVLSSELAASKKYLETLLKKKEGKPALNIKVPAAVAIGSPHAMRVFLGTREVTTDESLRAIVLSVLEESCEKTAEWKTENGADVARTSGGRIAWRSVAESKASAAAFPLSQSRCRSILDSMRCELPGLGMIWSN